MVYIIFVKFGIFVMMNDIDIIYIDINLNIVICVKLNGFLN